MSRILLALLALPLVHATADPPPRKGDAPRHQTVKVDGRGMAPHHADAARLAVADAQTRAALKVAGKLLSARKRDAATRLLRADVAVDPAPFVVATDESTPRWDKVKRLSIVRCTVTVDQRALAERWCRLDAGLRLAGKRSHAFKLDVALDGRASAKVVDTLRKSLRGAGLTLGSGEALGEESMSTAALVKAAREAKLDMVCRGSFTTRFDGGGKEMSWECTIDLVDIAKGSAVASVRDSGHLVLGGRTLQRASMAILRERIEPRVLGKLARTTLLASREDAAFALVVEGIDAAGARALEAWLRARDDVCAVVAPAFIERDATWRVGLLGTFRGKDLVRALTGRKVPVPLRKTEVQATGAILGVKKEAK